MKQNTTEAEREAKRMRRVLANRESARQTIRRRQALREELMKRVADLSQDNENMKMEKELVMREFLSLKGRNRELKEQMAKATKMKSNVEVATEIPSTSPSTELSLTPPNWSSRIKWAPWPPIFFDAACCDEGCSSNVPSCAWFYPLHPQTSEPYPPCSKSSSDKGVEAGAIEEEKHDGINPEEMPVGFDQQDKILIHDLVGDITDEQDIVIKVGEKMRDHVETIVTEKAEVVSFVPPVKKSGDPTAAAAARKRRKELIKLKSLHGRQNKLNG